MIDWAGSRPACLPALILPRSVRSRVHRHVAIRLTVGEPCGLARHDLKRTLAGDGPQVRQADTEQRAAEVHPEAVVERTSTGHRPDPLHDSLTQN